MSISQKDKPIVQRFGEKLRLLRTSRGMTLQQLARELGLIAHGYISELEKGKKLPTVEFVLKVARLFEVSTDQLLKDELEVIFTRDARES